MSSGVSSDRVETTRWLRRSLAVGVVALGACVLGAFFDPAQFFRAYLTAYLFYLGIALGSMVMLMVYHLTGGSWGFLIRRILEAGMKTLPLLAVSFIPIAYGIAYLYPWAQPELVAASPKLQYQEFYLAPVYFWIRAAAYFVFWLAMALLLSHWSQKQDKMGEPHLAWKCLKFSGFGAVLYGISIHFASVDWAMSLQPAFHSTIWGPLFALGQLLSAFAFALIVFAVLVRRPPLAEVASPKVLNDLGSLLFTLLIVWAYLAWFQFMLVWIANMKVDVIWYLPRSSGGWLWVIWAIVIFHFIVPFFLLLSRNVKRNSTLVAWIAGLILFMQLVFLYYQVMPNFKTNSLAEHWMDFIVPLGTGGVWLAYFLRQLQKYPLLPAHDYNLAAALRLRRLDEEEAEQERGLAYE
jgi:hypothetical protein